MTPGVESPIHADFALIEAEQGGRWPGPDAPTGPALGAVMFDGIDSSNSKVSIFGLMQVNTMASCR